MARSLENLKSKLTHLAPFQGETLHEFANYYKKLEAQITNSLGYSLPILVKHELDQTKWPIKIYRARKQVETRNPILRSEHSYPPAIFSNNSRANFKLSPVFYGSNLIHTCIYELLNRDNDIIKSENYYVSVWSIRDHCTFAGAPFLYSNIHKSNPYKLIADDIFIRLNEKMKFKSKHDEKNFINILKFLSDLFVKDKYYSISAFIAHAHLYENIVDVFLYPSIQTNGMGTGIAIHPNFVDESLILERVYLLNVNENSNITVNRIEGITLLKIGLFSNGNIIFREINPNTDMDFLTEDFGNNVHINKK